MAKTKSRRKALPYTRPMQKRTTASPEPDLGFWERLRPLILPSLLIITAGIVIYWPALNGGFLWDDNQLITDNQVTQDKNGIWDIWFQPSALLDFFPLTSSVYWAEWYFYKENTLGYHITNLVLHLLGAFMLWRLFYKLGVPLAWLGGLIFAVHPIMVESVAWISETKNTLSLPPFLWAMCAWINYRERRRPEQYALALFLFLVAMLAKASMIMFPFVILLYAWYQTRRLRWWDALEALPFLAVSIGIGIALFAFEHFGVGGQPLPLGDATSVEGLLSRFACAGLSISFYFSKFFLPVGLLPMYPQWPINPPSLIQFLPWPVMAGVFWWLWTKRDTWGRQALLGLGFFLLNIILFVGFRAITFMRFSWVMDHLAYIPVIGLIGLVTAGIGHFSQIITAEQRRYGIGALAGVLALLTFASHQYATNYVDLESLWSYTVRVFPQSWIGHNDLGYTYIKQGRLDEAAVQMQEAVAINPNYAEAHNNLGIIYEHLGRERDAVHEFEISVQLDPAQSNSRANLLLVQSHMTAPASPPQNGAAK